MATDQPVDLQSQARRWVVRLRSAEVSQAEIDRFTRWRDESAAHARSFAEARAQWSALRVAAGNLVRDRSSGPSSQAVVSRRVWLGGAIAASIGGAAYLAARPPLDLWPSLVELAADYRTDIGERRGLTFANTITVEMNTRTSLAVAGRAARASDIELIAGEIAVTAGAGGKEPAVPFIVIAGNGRASAARATFDLRYEGETATVTCLDGEVQVECNGETARLSTSQQIAYNAQGLAGVAATDRRNVGAWRRGLLVFDNQPLSEVVPEINRYRRGRIVLMNDDVGRLPLDATFRLDRIDEVVPKIAHIFNLRVRSLLGGMVLLS